MSSQAPAGVPKISGAALRFFRFLVRGYFRRHFRAVHTRGAELLANASGPLIVYGNHSSWWDPMVCVLLAQKLLPGRRHYAPMDAVPLRRYGILRRIGVFPVELGTARGAVEFLRTSEAILRSGGVLWVTPQGRFADVRERPLQFKAGLGALARRLPEVPLLPCAVEYTFWNERLPETLVQFAPTLHVSEGASTEGATEMMEAALESAMGLLREVSQQREPAMFRTLLEGRRGTGGFYALGKRIRGLWRGKGFREDESARDAGEMGR